MPIRFIVTAWPGEYGPNVVMLFCCGEEFAQAVVERRRRLARHRVVGRDRAALLGDLARRVEADDPVETRAVEVPLRGGDILLERGVGLRISFDDGHGSTLRRTFHRM